MLEITRTCFSEVGSLEKNTPATRAMQTCLLVWASAWSHQVLSFGQTAESAPGRSNNQGRDFLQ